MRGMMLGVSSDLAPPLLIFCVIGVQPLSMYQLVPQLFSFSFFFFLVEIMESAFRNGVYMIVNESIWMSYLSRQT